MEMQNQHNPESERLGDAGVRVCGSLEADLGNQDLYPASIFCLEQEAKLRPRERLILLDSLVTNPIDLDSHGIENGGGL